MSDQSSFADPRWNESQTALDDHVAETDGGEADAEAEETTALKCPVCKRTVIVTGLIASCGKCGIATGAADARESWEAADD